MINLSHKNFSERGAATIIITLVLLVTSTLIIIFAANYGMMQEKITANQARNSQAFEAAEAGLEFGINYLQKNSSIILASPISGYIQSYTSSSTTNVVLANNSKFSIVYSNPIANNYTLILITSTGTSDDGSSIRTVSQQVKFGSQLMSPPTVSLVSKGAVTMSGNAIVNNTFSNTTIQSASTASISGNGKTVTSTGTSSTSGSIKSDIQQNVSSLANLSSSDYFATYFGLSSNTIKNNADLYYSQSSSKNYSSTLNGVSGKSIWIDQTGGSASLSGNTTIGTATNPVLLIINGDFDISGNVTIYGFVFVVGKSTTETDITGNVLITGGLVTGDNFGMSGNTTVTYNPTVFTNLQNLNSMNYYAKVPGSWKDF